METAKRILHIEDNPDDVMLTALAFRKAGVVASVEVAADGEQALKALQPGPPESLPAIVLLDIKLPSISGLDVLTWIRQQPHLRRVPVVMFTSSLLPKDINTAYELGANSYLVKPSELSSLVDLAKTINHYWLQTNIQPALS